MKITMKAKKIIARNKRSDVDDKNDDDEEKVWSTLHTLNEVVFCNVM